MFLVEAVPSVFLCDDSHTDVQDLCPNRTDVTHIGTEEDGKI